MGEGNPGLLGRIASDRSGRGADVVGFWQEASYTLLYLNGEKDIVNLGPIINQLSRQQSLFPWFPRTRFYIHTI
jgi:hypothetical protein